MLVVTKYDFSFCTLLLFKVTEKDNVGDTSKHYSELHETDCLHSQGSGELPNGAKRQEVFIE